MSNINYHCTALMGTNKAGALKADADGYYLVVLGALDFYNSANQFYPLAPAEHLFESSGILMRRVASGNLRSEYGHPKFLPGMSKKDFLYRIMDIHEANICCHISEVELDKKTVKDKNGNPVVSILGRIKPSGPKGDALAASLENPKENVCFSIRSVTKDFITPQGQTIKVLQEIYTWDYVNEPGIYVANKWASPALEGLANVSFDRADMLAVKEMAKEYGNGLESNIGSNIDQTISRLGWGRDEVRTKSGLVLPPSARWV